ncbi:tetratricopeptide repeat protein [Photobacterium sp. 1_MG-2023]|uniref:tetratricopeptide repeat protein n=1 Tax=Photobacterium sp. 1_MG-2023 TaxID=3062646 RepID=UPI0026E11901|nr:tetratricopeptide repeat protein [Photobacterium sp. 1_MG-2023]MDO6705584.1 tetratricopeptide repeat protein [Photobacterium sp. 1_MG-2023]
MKLNAAVYLIMTGLAFAHASASAKPGIPEDPQAPIIALNPQDMQAPSATPATLDRIEALMMQAKFIDASPETVQTALQQLQPYLTGAASAKALSLLARVQQHQHQFADAEKTLQKALKQSPDDSSARLLLASVMTIQGKFDAAKQQCLMLIDQAPMLITSACSLNASFHQLKHPDQQTAVYTQLASLSERFAVADETSAAWVMEMLAAMALDLNLPQAAIQHLALPVSPDRTISYLTIWAKAKLAAGEPDRVLSTLGNLVQSSALPDDALLLELARAEKRKHARSTWHQQVEARVQLREQRQDISHAAFLAYYYLEISPVPGKALYWAKVNWQTNRLQTDQQLLSLAEQAMAVQS